MKVIDARAAVKAILMSVPRGGVTIVDFTEKKTETKTENNVNFCWIGCEYQDSANVIFETDKKIKSYTEEHIFHVFCFYDAGEALNDYYEDIINKFKNHKNVKLVVVTNLYHDENEASVADLGVKIELLYITETQYEC